MEKWRAIVSEQIASGQSVAAFSKERGVTSSQVFAWRKRIREAEKAQFVEVQIKPPEPLHEIGIRPQAKAIEVRLCGGRSIAVEPGFDAVIYVHCWRCWSRKHDRAAEFAHSRWCAGITDMAGGRAHRHALQFRSIGGTSEDRNGSGSFGQRPVRFRSRSGDRLKILAWDRDGFVLWYNRLEAGVFKLPRVSPGSRSVELRASELAMILDGIDMTKLKRVPRYERERNHSDNKTTSTV